MSTTFQGGRILATNRCFILPEYFRLAHSLQFQGIECNAVEPADRGVMLPLLGYWARFPLATASPQPHSMEQL
jgi:hypothetical protein